MPAIVVTSLVAAGVGTGVGVAFGTIVGAEAIGAAFLTQFGASLVLGGNPTLPKRPQQ